MELFTPAAQVQTVRGAGITTISWIFEKCFIVIVFLPSQWGMKIHRVAVIAVSFGDREEAEASSCLTQ